MGSTGELVATSDRASRKRRRAVRTAASAPGQRVPASAHDCSGRPPTCRRLVPSQDC